VGIVTDSGARFDVAPPGLLRPDVGSSSRTGDAATCVWAHPLDNFSINYSIAVPTGAWSTRRSESQPRREVSRHA
jgi:hypothetical protein